MDVKKVGEFIKRKRKEKKLTQKELAEFLKTLDIYNDLYASYKTLSKFFAENGIMKTVT